MDSATAFIASLMAAIFLPLLLSGQVDIRFKHFGKKDGLSQNSVFAIAQDGRGVMWLGTREGLNEFDGYRFKTHQHDTDDPNSIPSNDVRSLAFDSIRNCLWIGTMDGLARYDFNTGKWDNYHQQGTRTSQISSNVIRHIFVDSFGRVWISTSQGIKRTEVGSNTFQPISLPPQAGIDTKVVFEDSKKIWIGTKHGLYCFPEKKDLSQAPQAASTLYPELAALNNLQLKTIDQRQEGEYWFGTQANGIWRWQKSTSKLKAFRNQKNINSSLSHDNIRSTAIAPDGTLWVGTYLGLNQYIPGEEGFRRILSEDFNREGLRNSSIRSVFIDNRANLWVGTYYGGVHYLNEEFSRFQIFQHQAGTNSLSFNVVSSFAEAPNGDLWIGTEGGGLNFWNKETGLFSFLSANDGLRGNNVKTLLLQDKTLFIGMFQNGLYLFDTELRNMSNFLHDPSNSNSISNDNVYALLKNSDTLWVGTYGGGLNRMDIKTGKFTHFKSELGNANALTSDWIRSLALDSNGKLWVGTDNGLNKVIKYEKGKLIFQRFLEDIRVYAMLFYKNNIWIGTLGQGLIRFNPGNAQSTRFTIEHGLPGNSIFGIIPDENGYIWLSTSNGISRFAPSENVFTNYTHMDGLENLEFNYNAFYQTQAGDFLFGGTHGFTRFKPEDLRLSTDFPPVIFTELTALNRAIKVGGEDRLLTKPIDETEEITFKYGEANFTLHFAAMDFTNPLGNQFAYRMIGLNDEWTYATGKPEATYTLQQEGRYTFQLKAANKDGVWNPVTRQIKVRVLPPPARTWWAYLIYISIIGLAIAAIIRIVRLRQSYKLEQLEKEQQAVLHNMKLRFFTNVAHEFRTPLTLIIGPLEDLLQKGAFEKKSSNHQRLGIIYNNAQRMLDLVNQLLTFRKMEEGHEPMQVEKTDLITFLQQIFDSFIDNAQMRAIHFEIQNNGYPIEVWLDREKMNKVFFNLFSNAFKFTPDRGQIIISVREKHTKVEVEIRDNGPGIDRTLHEQIFQRFYEKTPGEVTSQIKSTGIGLSLSRQLVKLHKGKLELISEPGNGAAFTVSLPKGRKHFKDEALKIESEEIEKKPEQAPPLSLSPPKNEEAFPSNHEDQPLLLIVEDNLEVQAYIHSVFGSHYRIITAADGKEGLIAAKNEQPDLILSDVMMPRMDGFELCHRLKTELATSHIPVILLTARNTLDDRLEGLGTGADDYISKPFHPNELRLKVRNRLTLRQQMRKQFAQSRTFAPKEVAVTSADEEFLQRLIVLVEKNIENPDFKIEQFAQELAVSRALLFTKIKALTNYTPKNFLKSFRLKRAVQLLESKKLNVSEVAYKVGFKEPKYFSKVFKQEYGCNPSDYSTGRHIQN